MASGQIDVIDAEILSDDVGGSGEDADKENNERCRFTAKSMASQDNIIVAAPPGLAGALSWDLRSGERKGSPTNKAMLDDMEPPPGLGGDPLSVDADGGFEAETSSTWSYFGHMMPFGMPGNFLGSKLDPKGPATQTKEVWATDWTKETVLQATSLPCEDWKKMFPPSFLANDKTDIWKCQEPAVIRPSEVSLAEEYDSVAEDGPAYVTSGPEPKPVVSESAENEKLTAENARLALENERLKSEYMNPWAGAVNPADMYWSFDGCSPSDMDMAWAGMSPWSMQMAHTQMSMWHWGDQGSPKSQPRARYDSDLQKKTRGKSGSGDEMDRSHTFSDMGFMSAAGQDFNMGPCTTVMLRNLPNNYSRTMLLKLIDSEGFAGQYDFIYLPMDFKSLASLGYAFVNLLTPELATRFFEAFEGFHRWVVPSQKVCSVNWSHPYQGLDAHIERYRNSPVMHEDVPDDYKPWLFRDGERIPFPPSTKKLKVPRMRPGQEKNSEGASVEE
jgi:hypothetical protein